MAEISSSRLRDILAHTIGPTPWYWKTFPALNSAAGQRFVWTHHGDQGPSVTWFRSRWSKSPTSLGWR